MKIKNRTFSSAVMAHYVNYCTSFSCNFPVTDKQISAAAAEMLRYLHSSSQRFIPKILKGKRGLELGRFFNVKIINGGSDLVRSGWAGGRGRAQEQGCSAGAEPTGGIAASCEDVALFSFPSTIKN